MKIRYWVASLAVSLLAVSAAAQDNTPTTRDSAPDAAKITLTQVANGFTRPLLVTHAGDGTGWLYVVEQGGNIWLIRDGERQPTPFLDISDRVSPEATQTGGYTERGLLGLAFAPDYAESGLFYVNYTDIGGNTVVARYTRSADDPSFADPEPVSVILTQQQPFANHNGGHLAFGPDGYLYIAMGDGGSAGDPLAAGQDLDTWLGKILRIDVSTELYTVPADNPFVGVQGAREEIWAYGLRNPWRFTFDRATGDLYIGDVGQNQWEEINFQAADSGGGENYGWSIYEGSHPYSGAAAPADMILPIAEYSHGEGISVSGGYVYRGETIPDLEGVYLYGDFGTGVIWAVWRDPSMTWQNDILMDTPYGISSFGEDEAGELYLVDYGGTIYQFAAAS